MTAHIYYNLAVFLFVNMMGHAYHMSRVKVFENANFRSYLHLLVAHVGCGRGLNNILLLENVKILISTKCLIFIFMFEKESSLSQNFGTAFWKLRCSSTSEPRHEKNGFCICENKGADQLRRNCAADQRLCFRHIESVISLLPKSESSSL